MRMMPAAHLPLKNRRGAPQLAKGKPAAKVAHFSAPLKGLSRRAELTEGDPLLASVLTNWVVEDDRITVRPGYTKLAQIGDVGDGNRIGTLIPFYGTPQRLIAASGIGLFDMTGTEIGGNWGNDDWAWTSFSNLSATDYTIMVNGSAGVVSWDGSLLFAGFVKETITIPAGETWVDPLKFDKVLSHMNRLWFADSINLAVYYLPIQSKGGAGADGTLFLLPLNAIFKRGGHIVSICTWSIDGGVGLDDAIAIFTSNGEVAIYSGVNPEGEEFRLVGLFHFDAPMSKNSVLNFGGDLYVMISSGFVPMTTMIRAETEQLGKSDLTVMKEFEEIARYHRTEGGWQVILNHHTNHAICNMPIGGGKYQQMVRKMPGQVWAKWRDIPSRCWGWIDNRAYFGSDDGGIYQGGVDYFSDNGAAIEADVRFAWSGFKSVTSKSFKMVRLYTLTDGIVRPFIDVETDYDPQLPTNQPDTSLGGTGAVWNTATWDADYWDTQIAPQQNWQGVTGLGRVGAPRVRVSIKDCSFAITGLDVVYELGSIM